jgi:hypothetical protein
VSYHKGKKARNLKENNFVILPAPMLPFGPEYIRAFVVVF